MAVLSEALLHCTEGGLRLQALAAWLAFVQLLASHAPQVLERVAAQAAVVMLPVLELASTEAGPAAEPGAASAGGGAALAGGGGDDAAVQAAAEVLREIVVRQRGVVRGALRGMPPLPSLAVLRDVNAVLAQVRAVLCCVAVHACTYLVPAAAAAFPLPWPRCHCTAAACPHAFTGAAAGGAAARSAAAAGGRAAPRVDGGAACGARGAASLPVAPQAVCFGPHCWRDGMRQ